MCVNEVFTEMRPDGRLKTWSEADLCSESRHGMLCDRTQELRRPLGYRRTERSSSYGQLPPTPPMSYHSDHTSDSERSSKRRSGIYINDHKMLDVNRRHSVRHERQSSGDRVVYLGGSPLSRTLSRTPPRHPRSLSPSPVPEVYNSYESSSYRDVGDRDRERPTSIKVEIINERPKSHRRQGSSSKTSSSRDSLDEERRPRRSSDLYHGDQQRQRRKETEIARQNEAIANRPTPSTERYRRGSVSIVPVMSAQERMRLEEEKKRRLRAKREEEALEREREAEKQRLKDRFNFKNYHY
ncbi:hypothetical protein NUW58_g10583 [Xylaria curta]|uniref:Uncharacterized protein n=1 Tax=Xylaria curta TaxID=42375 RepID=A0ACC1MID9_9PEZI|nr:hypothetical protein NUW58_g10583 [Xylaria curta]